MTSANVSQLEYRNLLFERESTSLADVGAFWFLILPATAVAALVYVSGAGTVAIGIAVGALVLAAVISPHLGLYAYFAWQALDASVRTDASVLFTPAKAAAPFLLLLFVVRMGMRGSPMRLSRRFVLAMLLFGIYGVVCSFMAYEPLVAAQMGGQIVVQTLFLIMAVRMLDTRAYIRRLMFATVVGGVVAAVVMLVTGGRSGQFSRATLGEYANPNTTALALSIALAAIPGVWAFTRMKLMRVVYIAAAVPIFTAMLMTGSRSALLATVVAFGLGALLARGVGVFKRVVVGALCLAALGYGFVQVLSSDFLDRKSLDRLTFLVQEPGHIEDSRLEIWRLALQTYSERPLRGFGFGNTRFAMEEAHGWHRDIHSSYLGALVDGGPAGLVLFAYALWVLVSCVRGIGASPAALPASIMLLLLLASLLTHTIHFTKWFWVPVTLCLVLAEQAEREKRSWSATRIGVAVTSGRPPHKLR